MFARVLYQFLNCRSMGCYYGLQFLHKLFSSTNLLKSDHGQHVLWMYVEIISINLNKLNVLTLWSPILDACHVLNQGLKVRFVHVNRKKLVVANKLAKLGPKSKFCMFWWASCHHGLVNKCWWYKVSDIIADQTLCSQYMCKHPIMQIKLCDAYTQSMQQFVYTIWSKRIYLYEILI